MRCTLPALVFVLLTACTEHLPDIESTISKAARDADYPTLQPLPELISRSEAGSTVAVETEALERRVAALNVRARALKGRSIIDGATRLRLINAVKDRPA